MTNLLIQSGAKFNTSNKPDARYIISNDQFNWVTPFLNSLILTQNEGILLAQMLDFSKSAQLIYRASRDGFEASSFHSKCDRISNTITIIQTTSNSVFGGFTSGSWPVQPYSQNAFIYSLRRSGITNNKKLMINDPSRATYGNYEIGPTFGIGFGGLNDLYVSDKSNKNNNSNSNLVVSYQLPENLTYGSIEADIYLAGSRYWQTVEIEVYQLTSGPDLRIATALHNCSFYQFFNSIIFLIFYFSCL